MCEPSTSASVMMMMLWYRAFSSENSSRPMPVPIAVIIVRISLLFKILSRRAFSTLSTFPRSGSTAWIIRSRPCFAEPPALSPSTMNSSDFEGSRSEQSASFPGRFPLSSAPFLRVRSRAFRAASRARAAIRPFSMMRRASAGCSSKYVPSSSFTTDSTMP